MIRNERGFTLVEMMTTVGISLVIAAALFMAMRTGNDQLETADLKMTIQDSSREGLYKMIQEIRESSPTRITVSANSIQFNVPDPNSPINVSTYAVNWPGHSVTYCLVGSGCEAVTSCPNSGQVCRKNTTTGANSVMANDVTALSFSGDSGQPTVVTVTMSVQRTMKSGRVVPPTALQITGQARIRNTG